MVCKLVVGFVLCLTQCKGQLHSHLANSKFWQFINSETRNEKIICYADTQVRLSFYLGNNARILNTRIYLNKLVKCNIFFQNQNRVDSFLLCLSMGMTLVTYISTTKLLFFVCLCQGLFCRPDLYAIYPTSF